MKFYFTILLFSCFVSFTHLSLSATENGALLVKEHCAECHGYDGNGSTQNNEKEEVIPKIAGFSAFLILDTLSQFKLDDRKGKTIKNNKNINTDMNQISKKISNEDAETISIYLAEQTFIPAKQKSNLKLAALGKKIHQDLCNDCHGENGSSVTDDAPILAGQWKQYLRRQFNNIASFKRYIPKRMKRKFKKLSDQDKIALLEFYASSGSNFK